MWVMFLWRYEKTLNYHPVSTLSVSCPVWYSLSGSLTSITKIWAAAWQNRQNDLCTQQRLRSTWASTQSDQSLLSTWRNIEPLTTYRAHSEDSSDWGMPRLSLCWAHVSFCWFCRAASQLSSNIHPICFLYSLVLFVWFCNFHYKNNIYKL